MSTKTAVIILCLAVLFSGILILSGTDGQPEEGKPASLKEKIKSILKRSTDINMKDIDGKTVLFHAADNGNADFFVLLLKKGADITARDNSGGTVLHSAAARNNKNPEIFTLIIENGVDINARDNKGRTAAMLAARFGNTGALKALADLGADLNLRDKENSTVLTEAAEYIGDYQTIKMLVKRGADINLRDNEEKTALALVKKAKGAEALLQCGAETELKDVYGNTALHNSALYDKNPEKIKMLAEYGAKVNARNDSGRSVLQCLKGNKNMAQQEKEETLKYLIAKGAK
jgi:ankyrin repeat protein